VRRDRGQQALDSAAWWHHIQDETETPIRELIDGLDEIAEQCIPYAWLPGRARPSTAHSWPPGRILPTRPISSLVNRQRRVRHVRAIVIAAREALTLRRCTTTTAGRRGSDAQTARSAHRLRPHSALDTRYGRCTHQTIRVTAASSAVDPSQRASATNPAPTDGSASLSPSAMPPSSTSLKICADDSAR